MWVCVCANEGRILHHNFEKVVPVHPNGEEAPGKSTQNEDIERDDEVEEVLVVSAAHAVVHPRTVVIKHLQHRARRMR